MPTSSAPLLSGYIRDLKERLTSLKRSQILRISVLGGVHWTQVYAFRTPSPTTRVGANVRLDTLLRIERGLLAFEEEQADQASTLGAAIDGTACYETQNSNTADSRIHTDRLAGARPAGPQ